MSISVDSLTFGNFLTEISTHSSKRLLRTAKTNRNKTLGGFQVLTYEIARSPQQSKPISITKFQTRTYKNENKKLKENKNFVAGANINRLLFT